MKYHQIPEEDVEKTEGRNKLFNNKLQDSALNNG